MPTLSKPSTVQITHVCLTPKQLQRLDTHAQKQITSRSHLLRQAVERYLRELDAQEEAA